MKTAISQASTRSDEGEFHQRRRPDAVIEMISGCVFIKIIHYFNAIEVKNKQIFSNEQNKKKTRTDKGRKISVTIVGVVLNGCVCFIFSFDLQYK